MEIRILPSDDMFEVIDTISNSIAVLTNPQLFFGMKNDPLDVGRLEVIEYLEKTLEELSH